MRWFLGSVSCFILVASMACVAPIASRSSPAHTTHIEIENATTAEYDIEITLTEGAFGEVGYRGRLRPGEVESLYLVNGEQYHFLLKDPETGNEVASTDREVWAYTNLVFDGQELVLGEATVAVDEEAAEEARVAIGSRNSLIPLYVGVTNVGFAPTPTSVQGTAQLESSGGFTPIVGLSGETRLFSDYLGFSGNMGYAPSEFFHNGFISFGPIVKFRPYDEIDPYVFATAGIAALYPKEVTLPSGESVDPEFILNMAYDGGGGVLFAVTESFTIDTQVRIHSIRLNPLVHENSNDFDNENLFTEGRANFPEFRVGIRYAMSRD